jgi:hypothetical protein
MIHAVKAIAIATLMLGAAIAPVEAQRLSESRKALTRATILHDTALQKLDRKNPVLAGALSLVVAGLGSRYAVNRQHAAAHLGVQMGALLLFTVGKTLEWRDCFRALEPEPPSCGAEGEAIYMVSAGIAMLNGTMSIFNAVADAREYNEKRRREGF